MINKLMRTSYKRSLSNQLKKTVPKVIQTKKYSMMMALCSSSWLIQKPSE